MSSPTIVLVHGAWHGAWCWEALTPLLDDAGVAHAAVELPFTSPADDIAVTGQLLDSIEGPKILVGHSYGGLVISGAADGRADVEHLVYLCALMIAPGEHAYEVLGRVRDLPVPKLIDGIRSNDDGTTTIDPTAATGAFFEQCSPEAAARAVARLRPMESSLAAVGVGAPWTDVTSTYVLCRRDQAIPFEGQQEMAQLADRTVVLDTDHSPFLSRPQETAQVLIDIARSK